MVDRKRGRNRIWTLLLAVTLMLPLLTACGETGGQTVVGGHATIIQKEPEKEEATESEPEKTKSGLYIVEQMDMENETITLLSLTSGTMLRYSYNLTTRFYDRYGKSASWTNFTCGQVVHIGELLSSGALSEIMLSDEVWVQDQITSFSIDLSGRSMEIGGEEFTLSPDLEVFSGDKLSAPELIGKNDILRVVGKGDEIMTIAVTTGHGYVKLVNTTLFDDSLILIGSKIVTKVYEGATIEVGEGTYAVTAANKGYGMTRDYKVERNATTVINMEELAGNGPKLCELTFKISVTGAAIAIDGKDVNANEVLEVAYGRHALKVSAEGYETWNKTLVVNSPKATIELNLTGDGTGESGDTAGNEGDEAQDNSGNNTENSGGEDGENTDGDNSDANTGTSGTNSGTNAGTNSGTGSTNSGTNTNTNSGSNGTNTGTNSTSTNSNTNSGTSSTNSGTTSKNTTGSTNSTSSSRNTRSVDSGSSTTDYKNSTISDRAQAEVDYLTTMSSLLSNLFNSD